MKILYALFIIVFSLQLCYSQNDSISSVDNFYKEDQFYVGITYNLLTKEPSNLSQNGFSNGIHFGFIKDMPINSDRNIAFGIGLGYSLNSFNQNLLIEEGMEGTFNYSILDDSRSYLKNKFSNQIVELPIEFRWRTSTVSDYRFWRIYTGFKLGYVVTSTTKFTDELVELKYRNISDFNKLQYGLTLSAGYNTWNLYMYYGLNPVFSEDVILNDEKINTSTIKIGLMFYIL